MKKLLLKIAVCLLVFVGTIFVGVNFFNQGNSDMTTTMKEATFPLIHIQSGQVKYNTLRGMIGDVDLRFVRDSITPLEEGRNLTFVVEKYDNIINDITFEVRNLDGTRLVEKTQVTDYNEDSSKIKATVTIKDLIENNKEYNFIIKLQTVNQSNEAKEIKFYTRIINATEYNVNDKLTFVSDFHTKTFDKEQAKELSAYLEPKRKADNTTYSKVDIHNSLNQVSWGDLDVKEITTPEISVIATDKQTASILMKYRAQTTVDSDVKTYNIVEFYRIRLTSSRVYLLDFERTMNQIFDSSDDVFASNKIMLGIRDENIQMKESSGGGNLVFVNEGQLLCYHSAENKFANIFSFYDENDSRAGFDDYNIKILSVDEIGNACFSVYGYMNRGIHEGETGILFYQYNGMLNQIEELVFVPSNKSSDIIKSDVEQLCYRNKDGIIYIYLDGTIMAINPDTLKVSQIATDLNQESFKVSESDEMLVWQNSSQVYDCTSLILMNLNSGVKKEILSSGTSRMKPLGFIQEDLIYGVAHYEDIVEDATGTITFPMYNVCIQNEKGDILKNYEPRGAYVVDCSVEGNLITLNRVKKSDDGNSYVETIDDQIVNNEIVEKGQNSSEIVVTENYEKIIQLVLKNKIETKNLKITDPKEVLIGESREVENDMSLIDRYYVYGRKGNIETFSRASDAVNKAYSENGVVIDGEGYYIWKKSSRSTRNQIMKIKEHKADEQTSDLAVCLQVMLECKGISVSAEKLMSERSAAYLLSEHLTDARVLDLKGVSLDSVLYYVNMDIPVLAMLNDQSAVLIIGFNELNVVLMDPDKGTIYKKGINDSKTWFAQNGNQFLTYCDFE